MVITVQGVFLWHQGGFATVAMFGLVACFIFGMRMLLKEKQIDILRAYFLSPQDFSFIDGEIVSGSYSRGDSRASSKIIVQGLVAYEGKELHSLDHFSTFIWPFTTREEDEQIQEGDDWHDLKGKRVFLPVKAVFIVEKKNPHAAALVAIDKGLVTDAVRRAEKAF